MISAARRIPLRRSGYLFAASHALQDSIPNAQYKAKDLIPFRACQTVLKQIPFGFPKLVQCPVLETGKFPYGIEALAKRCGKEMLEI